MAQGEAVSSPSLGTRPIASEANRYPQGVGDADYPLSKNGRQRCVATSRVGTRCAKYAMKGSTTCAFHGGKSYQSYLRSVGRYAELLGTDDDHLREIFDAFVADPDITDVRSELALQRTLLASTLEKIDAAGKQAGDLSMESIAALTQLNKAVAELALVSDKVQMRGERAVNVDQLHWFVDHVVSIIAEVLDDPEKVSQVAERLEGTFVPHRGRGSIAPGRGGDRVSNALPAVGGAGNGQG